MGAQDGQTLLQSLRGHNLSVSARPAYLDNGLAC